MIYTGTTPTIELNFSEDVDFSLGSSFAVTFSYPVSEKVILEKTEEDLEIGEHTVGVFLTQEEQILLPDSQYDGLSQVTVNPIPSNYGLITWNGSILTVS